MITESMIYWVTRLDYISGLFWVLLAVTATASTVTLIAAILAKQDACDDEDLAAAKTLRRTAYAGICVSLVLLIAAVLVPTTKEYCAVKVIPMIANNKNVQQLPNNMIEEANEWIDSLKPIKDK